MTVKKQLHPLVWAFFMSCSLGIVSCVDSKYDLDKDIDMTVNVGGEYLTIPAGGTEQALLSTIIEVEKDDMLQPDENTREYHLTKKETITGSEFKVNPVMADAVDETGSPISAVTPEDFPSSGDKFDVSPKDESSTTKVSSTISVEDDVKALKWVNGTAPSKMNIQMDLTPGFQYDAITLTNIRIEFPEVLKLENTSSTGKLENNVLTIDKHVINSSSSAEGESAWTIELAVKGYNLEAKTGVSGANPIENGKISINDDVLVKMTVSVNGVQSNQTIKKLEIVPHITLDEMEIGEICGRIDPEINIDPTKFTLDDLPDFLSDDATELDIKNPVFSLNTNNPIGAPILTNLVMKSFKNGQKDPIAEVTVNDIELAKNTGEDGDRRVVIAREEEDYQADEVAVVPNLNDLIKKIPDYIEVSMEPRVDSENFYELEVKDYQINDGLCDVDIPLTFGSNLLIVYNDSIKDLQKDLEDLDIISFKKAVVTLTAASTIPLKMTLNADDVDIKDKAGRPIENIKVSIGEGKETVNPSTDGTTEAESEVEIILESDNAFDTLSRIDRICFKLKADSKESSGVPLKDTQWIQVKKSALQVPGGVNIDLN